MDTHIHQLFILLLSLWLLLGGCEPLDHSQDCIEVGQTRDAIFTDKFGQEIRVSVLIGENGSEIGRCGSDPISTGWTQACLNHDMCQIYMWQNDIPEGPGGTGPNCGDEFIAASDDFFNSVMWGCDGGPLAPVDAIDLLESNDSGDSNESGSSSESTASSGG